MEQVTEERFALAARAFRSKIHSYAYRARHGTNLGRARSCVLDMDIADIEQELLMVLLRAVESYDPDNGATFNTYAQRCFQNRIISLAREQSADKRIANSYREPLDVEWIDGEAITNVMYRLHGRPWPSAEDEAMANLEVLRRLTA